MSRFKTTMARVSAGFWVAALAVSAGIARADTEVKFNRDIKPILSENCFHCHGPDSVSRKAGLRFDREDAFFTDRKHGKPIVKGDPEHSTLIQRVNSDDDDEVMPPPETHKVLKAEQKLLLKRWVEQGAKWEGHWSLVAPVRPTVPGVKNLAWPHNPIDAFILAQLEQAGLAPAPEADRRALIRRVSFDLIGLPPTPQEVESFVADSSPNAYEKLVDRLMANPHYGEHRARYWLDAARYADTHGLHFDNYREIWPYRDWVINAFNANQPFDKFTTDQLAGDLLPNRTTEQHIATGFIRAGVTTNEGGTIAEENLVMYARDRAETISRVFLGLTMNCCVCHDHKFDPITQKDFYSLSAFVNNGTMGALDGNVKASPPALVIPQKQDQPRWATVTAEAEQARRKLDERRALVKVDFDRWNKTATADSIGAAIPTAGLTLSVPLAEGAGETVTAIVEGVDRQLTLSAGTAWQAGFVAAKGVQVAANSPISIPDAGDFDGSEAFTVSVWAKLPRKATGAIVSRMDDSDNYRGWDLWIENDRVASHFVSHWDDNAIKVISAKPIDPAKWHHICLAYNATSKASGISIYVDGVLQQLRTTKDELKGSLRNKAPLKIGQRSNGSHIKGLIVQDLRIYSRTLLPAEIGQLAKASRLTAILAKSPAKRSVPENNELFDWYLANLDKPAVELTTQLAKLDQESIAIKSRGARTLVVEEKPTPPVAFVLYRGAYDQRRDQVAPATPAVLPPLPEGAPHNRLGLAQWLLRPENPLVSRVVINRLWLEMFGTGIVKSAEDFGIMGDAPSHPELLDWLAVDFRESGWDMKRAIKQMVMSSTYRQAATITPEKLEKDPDNRLLARGPRYRLDAEQVRDNALVVSGLLVPTIGGPSVRPYQPPGIWEVGMPESNTHVYKEDTGENLYRRSVYTFWKRAAPPASMEIFNAPSRETCTVRRERTNTPLQALVTLNDTQYVEASRALAQLAIKGSQTTDGRIDLIARRALSRPLTQEESAIAASALTDLLAYYSSHAEDAGKLLNVGESKRDESINPGEHAAWTLLASQLMNLDEALNK